MSRRLKHVAVVVGLSLPLCLIYFATGGDLPVPNKTGSGDGVASQAAEAIYERDYSTLETLSTGEAGLGEAGIRRALESPSLPPASDVGNLRVEGPLPGTATDPGGRRADPGGVYLVTPTSDGTDLPEVRVEVANTGRLEYHYRRISVATEGGGYRQILPAAEGRP